MMMHPGTARNGKAIRAKREDGAAAAGLGSAETRVWGLQRPADRMMNSVFFVLVLLTGSWQGGHAGSSPSPEELPQRTQQPAGWPQTSAEPTTSGAAGRTLQSQTGTRTGPKIHFYSSKSTADLSQHINAFIVPAPTHSAAADTLSSTSMFSPPLKTPSTEGIATESLPTFSPPAVQDAGSKTSTSSTRLQSESPPAASTRQTWASGRSPARPTRQTWASGRSPARPTRQTWASGRSPAWPTRQTWASGRSPARPTRQTWASGRSPRQTWASGRSPAWPTRQTWASGRSPARPTRHEFPSELDVGDEELKGSRRRSSFPLDPLLAALLSVFIITTAVVFIVLFFKFRQRTNHPEFHRLQDLPMDDLMEDTPLSMYTH